MTTVFHVRTQDTFTERKGNLWRKKRCRTNQGSNFLGGSFSNWDNVRVQKSFYCLWFITCSVAPVFMFDETILAIQWKQRVNLFYVLDKRDLYSGVGVRFFITFLFFHQMIALQKLWKVFFVSSKKLFSFSSYSDFCIFSSSFPDSKGQMEVE